VHFSRFATVGVAMAERSWGQAPCSKNVDNRGEVSNWSHNPTPSIDQVC